MAQPQQPQQAPGQQPATPDKKDPKAPVTPPVPPPEKGETKPTTPKPEEQEEVTNSKMLIFDNGGEAKSERLKNKTYFINNFDASNFSEERKNIVVQTKSGAQRKINGREVTHLSNESLIGCTPFECFSKIASVSEHNQYTQNCVLPSLANELANLKFSFDKLGRLRFIGNVNGVPYGAKNIEYSFDGKRRLYIAPFVAAAVVNETETYAIQISAYSAHSSPEAGTNIKAVYSKNFDDPETFKIRSTISIDLGRIENGRFATAANARRYVGGLLTFMEPIAPKVFKTFDDQE